MRRAREVGSLLPVSSIAPDGLCVVSDGTVLRALELAALAPLRMGSEPLQSTARAIAELAAMLCDRQALQLITHARPLNTTIIVGELHEQAAGACAALQADGLGDRGRALERLEAATAEGLWSTRSAARGWRWGTCS